MLPIIAKCIVRGDDARTQRMLANLGYSVDGSASSVLLATVKEMWRDRRAGASDRLVQVIDSMIDIVDGIARGGAV